MTGAPKLPGEPGSQKNAFIPNRSPEDAGSRPNRVEAEPVHATPWGIFFDYHRRPAT